MIPKISEHYFQTLLSQQDALHAVSTISEFWSHRADNTKPLFGLSLPEYHCQLILIYSGEVGNGGHSQFFVNRGDNRLEDFIAAMGAVQLPDLGRFIRLAGETPTDLQTLHKLDEQAWDRMSGVDSALQAFLKGHSGQILRPERAL